MVAKDQFGNNTVVQGKIPLQIDLQISEKVVEDQFCEKTVVQGKIQLQMD